MLIEIQSDAFKGKGIKNGKVSFHKGLNTIVATEPANNSTGKTSFLLAIDFAFGGNAYGDSPAKIVENVGHHTINFAFDFNGEKLYFSRSTQTLDKVNVCNSDYSVVKEIPLDKYHELLIEKYGFEDKNLTLRGAVSPYLRISHKSSKDLADFLKGSSNSKARDCVINLEKLFNHYVEIESEKSKADDAVKANETFKDAVKRNFIPSSIKKESDLKEVQERIEELKTELSQIAKIKDDQILSFDLTKTEKLKELEQKYRNISSRKTKLENKIAVAEHSLEGLNVPTKEELSVLQSYFPSLNVKKVYAVERFHESLTEVLKLQITDEIQYLSMQLRQTNIDFESIKNEYEKAFPDGTVSKASFDAYGEKFLEIQKLYDSIKNYKKGKELAKDDIAAKTVLNTKEIDVLRKISEQINNNMALLNKNIQNGIWKNPILTFIPPKTNKAKGISNYTLSSGTDTGDGTGSANLIMFDLTVLKMTKLPVVAHDLFVRSELDENRKEDCIKLYASETEKQIFTAFRAIKNYSSEIQKLIEDNSVLKLFVGGGELYGTDKWTKSTGENNELDESK